MDSAGLPLELGTQHKPKGRNCLITFLASEGGPHLLPDGPLLYLSSFKTTGMTHREK